MCTVGGAGGVVCCMCYLIGPDCGGHGCGGSLVLVMCVHLYVCPSVCTEEKLNRLSKNPKRVGANFRQQVAMETSDEDWLPSFGQVWSFGPRSQSR